MKKCTFNALLVAGGFALGTLGVKAVTSEPARKLYVQGVAAGLQAKNSYDEIVEQAKAQVDDIVSEATYLTSKQAAKADKAADDAEKAEA